LVLALIARTQLAPAYQYHFSTLTKAASIL